MSKFDYDLFVIGAGSGGVRAARIAAQCGAKVAVAEEYRVGGTCVIRGCVPKKLFSYASKFSSEFKDAKGYGWTIDKASFDWPTLLANKDAEIDRLNAIYISNLKAAGVEIIESRAELRGPNEVHIVGKNRNISAKYILIATGGTPFMPDDLPGIEYGISSNEAFHLDTLPSHITVVGGGYIAVEFAGIYNGLGVETTLVYRGEQILRGFDDDLRNQLAEEMTRKGIKIQCEAVLEKIEKTSDGLVATLRDGTTNTADQFMFAIGRRPNIAGLGLEQAGVKLNKHGAIAVDAFSQTNIENIYAVGDVTDRVNLTPVAIREGHAFADTVFGDKQVQVDHEMIATAVFSQPEIGTIGLSEAEARKTHAKVDIYKSVFRPMKYTLSGREEKTLMKLVVDGETDRVLGCHLLGPDSAEMAQILGVLIKMGAKKADFDATIAVHPTASEELVTMRNKVNT